MCCLDLSTPIRASLASWKRAHSQICCWSTAGRQNWRTGILPEAFLRSDEWYNDFILKICRVRDILGVQLFDDETHSVTFVIHRGFDQHLLRAERVATVIELFEPLAQAARLHTKFRKLSRDASARTLALDLLGVGVIVTDGDRRVIASNLIGDRILRTGDGLLVRSGQLNTRRSVESAKLAELITGAVAETTGPTAGCMQIAKSGHWQPYRVTVVPLSIRSSLYDCPSAMVLIHP